VKIPVFLCWAVALAAAENEAPPSWLRDAAASKIPAYGPNVPAVVLLNEQRIGVDESGRRTTTTRLAVKVLTKEGAASARGSEVYHTDTAKIKDFRAWMLYPSGNVKRYGKEDILDASLTDSGSGALYSQSRVRLVSGKREADVGNVFGYESVSEDKTVFAQEDFSFQTRLPILAARFVVTLPSTWTAKAVILNYPAGIEPSVSSGVYTWQLNDLPYVEEEEASPAWSAISPRIALSYFPPPGSAPGIRPLSDWADVARWMAELADPKAQPSAAIDAKAKELVANSRTEFEKIQAIARFVQATTYVLISRGVGRGGGYTPHAAADVFLKGYGDCKDKSVLMRAMLKSVGIESAGVGIFSGDRTAVRPEWPSPHQFNHAITAIRVSKETDAPAVLEHATLGRILFFDPTDPYVPAGYLPHHEQASYALIEDGQKGALVMTPASKPSSADLSRKGQVTLSVEGGISGSVVEVRRGGSAARMRSAHKELSKPAFDQYIERWLSSSIPGVRVKKVEISDAGEEFRTSVEFETGRYAQIPNSKMQIFRASIFRHREAVHLTGKERRQPVVLNTDAFEEEIRVSLPEGFKVDEIPDPVALTSEYGAYQAKWEGQAGSLVFTRRLETPARTVPASQYGGVKKFFDAVLGAGNQPVVLLR
jgi:hypothetical protein